jgi:hypothetical protein
MAVMDALLRIKAAVTGEDQISGLGRALGGLNKTAGSVTGGLKGIGGATGGLLAPLSALTGLLSGAGLMAMAKGAIDAADDMNDLAQKTGVSVEQLSRFQQAAQKSGTDIDAVGAAMVKFGRNLQTGNKATMAAMKELGVNATDATGKIRPLDQMILEAAEKLSKMEDGGKKASLAMDLFGKSGAGLIPFLNNGRTAIESLESTMSTKFAKSADELNDKMVDLQTKFTEIGVAVGEVLLPALTKLADVVIGVADAFGKMPGWMQNTILLVGGLAAAFLILAPAIVAVTTLLTGISAWFAGLSIMATIAGWAPALIAPFAGLLAWLSGTFLPAIVAFFSGPVGWTVLAIAAIVAMAIAFREPIMQFLAWLAKGFVENLVKIGKLAYDVFLKPWVELYNKHLREPVSSMIKWLTDAWNYAATFISVALAKVAKAAQAPFLAVINIVRSLFNSVLGFIARGVNSAIGAINVLIAGYNRLPTPDIPLIPQISVPQFAEGGVVDRPTFAMVGEGGEREYIIPESKMGAASAAYLAGTRGAGVITGTAGPAVINITTGPVLQQDGQQWVTTRDLERAMRATEAGTLARIRTPAGRTALGIR